MVNVQFADAGETAARVSNAAGSATSVPAILTVLSAVDSAVEISRPNAAPGDSVAVPIRLLAQGNENAARFSITFDASVLTYSNATLGSGATAAQLNLNTNEVGSGKIGFNLALSAGNNFAAGTQELVVVTFEVTAGIANTTATISFSDQPLAREVSDAQANALTATYVDGSVTIGGGGFEADVSPAPDGNGAVTITDWVKVGRYSAGLDAAPDANTYQRADCACRDSYSVASHLRTRPRPVTRRRGDPFMVAPRAGHVKRTVVVF